MKKTDITVTELVYGGMQPTDVQKAVEKEFEMALQDRVMEETKDKKNAVESYVYDMRNKVCYSLTLNHLSWLFEYFVLHLCFLPAT